MMSRVVKSSFLHTVFDYGVSESPRKKKNALSRTLPPYPHPPAPPPTLTSRILYACSRKRRVKRDVSNTCCFGNTCHKKFISRKSRAQHGKCRAPTTRLIYYIILYYYILYLKTRSRVAADDTKWALEARPRAGEGCFRELGRSDPDRRLTVQNTA